MECPNNIRSTWLVQGRSSDYVWIKQGYVEWGYKNVLIRDGNEPKSTTQLMKDSDQEDCKETKRT